MNTTSFLKIFIIFVVIIGIGHVVARPNYRMKRVSDAHLADLETRIALNNKLKGVAITMPVAGGKIDPLRIGRKRRSQQTHFFDVLFNQSEEDKGDPKELDYDEELYNYYYRLGLQ